MTTQEILIELRTKNRLSQKQLADAIHIHPSLMSSWERGTRRIRSEHLKTLADYFKVSTDYLMGRDPFRTAISQIALTQSPKAERAGWPLPSVVRVPIVVSVQAGKPLLDRQQVEGWEEMPASTVSDGDYFFLRVQDNSMIGSRITTGDLALVRQQSAIGDSEIALVMASDRAVLKRIYIHGDYLILVSEQSGFRPILARAAEISVLGKVMRVWATPR